MSDLTVSADPALVSTTGPFQGLSAGGQLRQAREAAGLHIAALAVSLKVPVKKLEALESDRIDLLPDAVFARALASSVCRTLKIDAAAVLAALPQTTVARVVPPSLAGGDSLRADVPQSGRSMQALLAKPSSLIGLVLVAATVAVAFYPGHEDAASVDAAQPVEAKGVPPLLSAAATEAAAAAASAVGSVLPSVNEAVAPLLASSGSVLPAQSVSSAASTPLAPMIATSAPAAPVPTAGIVVFRAKGGSWIQVTDAAGVVHLRKTLVSGETAAVSGELPLSVVVGKADTTEVQVRGKDFDLVPLTRDNVARFEVR
jgi:cytoskeleton protein RodZ